MLKQLSLNRDKNSGVKLIKFLELIPVRMIKRYREIKRENESLKELEDTMFSNIEADYLYGGELYVD